MCVDLLFLTTSMGVHVSMVVPPTEASIIPMGIWVVMWIRRANTYPMAESSLTVLGEHTSQSPLRKWRFDQLLHSWRRGKACFGLGLLLLGMVSMRMLEKLADAISRFPFSTLWSGNSMLLWPPSIQTSPMRMLVSLIFLFFPVMRISAGFVLAGLAGKVTVHFLFCAAMVVCVLPANVVVICSPGVAHPHRVMGLFLWITILDWKRLCMHRSSLTAGMSMTFSLGICFAKRGVRSPAMMSAE